MYHFFVEPSAISDETVIVSGSDFNHIKNVLRLEKNEQVSIYDGHFHEYICKLNRYEKAEVIFDIIEEIESDSELESKLYLFQGLPKSDKLELIIQKAVELGAYEIIPVKMQRSIVKYDAKKAKSKLERWQAISESAAKQSGRTIIPAVHEIMDYKAALEYAKSLDCVLVPYEHEEGISHTKDIISRIIPGMSVGIFIGPEGGFEDSEIEKAVDFGFSPVSLGRRILRTETAGLCALSVLMFMLEK